MKESRKLILLVVVAVLVLGAATARASAPLAPGGVVYDPAIGGSVFTASAVPSGTLIDTLVSPTTGPISGTVTSKVYRRLDTNLTFSYQFTVTGGGQAVTHATIDAPWHPWIGVGIIDCGSDAGGTSTSGGAGTQWIDGDPYSINRKLAAQFESITLFFQSQTNAGTIISPTTDFSAVIWFETDVDYYSVGDVAIIDGGQSGQAKGFVPTPVPGALMLGAMGLGMVVWLKRRGKVRG